ncbi:hypothetical protein MP228_011034 [Amoeboaphelidium protococcarum]|nr:hypothetical protein MP228_011034 [Amoeboaphelidium protococcarum]
MVSSVVNIQGLSVDKLRFVALLLCKTRHNNDTQSLDVYYQVVEQCLLRLTASSSDSFPLVVDSLQCLLISKSQYMDSLRVSSILEICQFSSRLADILRSDYYCVHSLQLIITLLVVVLDITEDLPFAQNDEVLQLILSRGMDLGGQSNSSNQFDSLNRRLCLQLSTLLVEKFSQRYNWILWVILDCFSKNISSNPQFKNTLQGRLYNNATQSLDVHNVAMIKEESQLVNSLACQYNVWMSQKRLYAASFIAYCITGTRMCIDQLKIVDRNETLSANSSDDGTGNKLQLDADNIDRVRKIVALNLNSLYALTAGSEAYDVLSNVHHQLQQSQLMLDDTRFRDILVPSLDMAIQSADQMSFGHIIYYLAHIRNQIKRLLDSENTNNNIAVLDELFYYFEAASTFYVSQLLFIVSSSFDTQLEMDGGEEQKYSKIQRENIAFECGSDLVDALSSLQDLFHDELSSGQQQQQYSSNLNYLKRLQKQVEDCIDQQR